MEKTKPMKIVQIQNEGCAMETSFATSQILSLTVQYPVKKEQISNVKKSQ